MQLTLSGQLSQFAHLLQEELIPRLETAVGTITPRSSLFIAACAMAPLARYLPSGRWPGRPSKDRVSIARAFLAKSVYGFSHTRQLLDALQTDSTLRGLCGWTHRNQIPHESTFSRAFAEFARAQLPQQVHEAIIHATHGQRLVGHIARDGTAVPAREYYPDPPAKTIKPKPKRKPGRPKGSHRKTKADAPAAETRIERQLRATTIQQMLHGIPTQCDMGGKCSSSGNPSFWRGYKLHLDVADGQIPITALLTSASVHDSQVAIPLMHITSRRVTYLYDLMDSAYDARAIRTASYQLGHKPIIDFHTRPKPKTQLPVRVKPQPQLSPAEQIRYRTRTMVERVFSRLKDEFGARSIRVRGAPKVMAHLMFGVVALTVDQLLRLHRR